jgi:hypothetical protein
VQGRILELIDASSGAQTTIREGVGGELPRFFPDGRSVVYRTGQNTLMRLDLESKAIGRLVSLNGDVSIANYAFAPDGHAALLVVHDWTTNTRNIRVLTVATGEVRALVPLDPAGNPSDKATWSHDSRFIVYADATADATVPGTTTKRSELWRIPKAGGTPVKLGLTFDDIEQVAIAPDGRHLAFYFERYRRVGLWVIDRLLPASELRSGR